MNREPTEAELQAALQEQLERVRVEDVVVQVAVDLLNLAAVRAGLAGGREGGPEPDLEQARIGIEAVRALLPLVEDAHGERLRPVKDALAQLQLHYAQSAPAGARQASGDATGGGETARAEPGAAPGGGVGGSGPAQRSGRLWVPGQ